LEDFHVERLSAADVADNVALARSVGWQDVDSDWRVLHEGGIVLGVRLDGTLVAQGALGVYDHGATIAKMIVSPSHRRRGLALRILDALFAEASALALDVLGLVATAQGRPVYEQRQFAPVGDVVVYTGTPRLPLTSSDTKPLADALLAARFEEPRFGVCRERMLAARFRESIATTSMVDSRGALRGYAMAAPQDALAFVGPVVADAEDDARALAHALFAAVRGPVRIDVPGEQHRFREWLRGTGLVERITNVEMARGASRLPWQVPQRFALATQAWG
jgi:GNAT superfamily N-acetyltransferase